MLHRDHQRLYDGETRSMNAFDIVHVLLRPGFSSTVLTSDTQEWGQGSVSKGFMTFDVPYRGTIHCTEQRWARQTPDLIPILLQEWHFVDHGKDRIDIGKVTMEWDRRSKAIVRVSFGQAYIIFDLHFHKDITCCLVNPTHSVYPIVYAVDRFFRSRRFHHRGNLPLFAAVLPIDRLGRGTLFLLLQTLRK